MNKKIVIVCIALIAVLILLSFLKLYLLPASPSTLNVTGICFKRAGELKQIRDAIKAYVDDCSEYPIKIGCLVPKYINKNNLCAFNSSVVTKKWASQDNNLLQNQADRFAYLYFGKNCNGIILSERPGIWLEDSFCKDGINVITDDLGLTIIKKDDSRRGQLEQLIQAQVMKE